MSRYQVTVPADAPPVLRRMQPQISNAFNRISLEIDSIRSAVAPIERPEITGSRSGDTVAVLTALLAALDARGLITDSTTP